MRGRLALLRQQTTRQNSRHSDVGDIQGNEKGQAGRGGYNATSATGAKECIPALIRVNTGSKRKIISVEGGTGELREEEKIGVRRKAPRATTAGHGNTHAAAAVGSATLRHGNLVTDSGYTHTCWRKAHAM